VYVGMSIRYGVQGVPSSNLGVPTTFSRILRTRPWAQRPYKLPIRSDVAKSSPARAVPPTFCRPVSEPSFLAEIRAGSRQRPDGSLVLAGCAIEVGMFRDVVGEGIRRLHPFVRGDSCCRHVAAFHRLIIALRCRKVGGREAFYLNGDGMDNGGDHRWRILSDAPPLMYAGAHNDASGGVKFLDACFWWQAITRQTNPHRTARLGRLLAAFSFIAAGSARAVRHRSDWFRQAV